MTIKALIKPGEYHDSISLMLVARALSEMSGVRDAAVIMGTEANKSILETAGLLADSVKAAGSNDLVIAVAAETEALADTALQQAESLLRKKAESQTSAEFKPKTLRAALSLQPQTNVVLISVAGRYAADEAWDALRHGLHVFLFSDHVSLEDEIALKQYARDHGLLLMGPGAGTTVLNQVALGFANALPAGPIGIVAAAGTGLQEVSTLLARRGSGISQGIGVGGRDLSEQVGGIMMLEALKALQADPHTAVLVLVSKPPAEAVAQAILGQVSAGKKPTVICFLGGELAGSLAPANVIPAQTLQEAALRALEAAHVGAGDTDALLRLEVSRLEEQARDLRTKFSSRQKYLRGLFSGGTLCYEAQVLWKDLLGRPVYSNAPLPGGEKLDDPMRSHGHTAVDMGEEEFTLGRLHPMIDQSLRIRRLLQEARDPEVAAILLDVVLGYGAHPHPASELGPAIAEAQDAARREGRSLCIVASVTGTEEDPQCLSRVGRSLEQAGAIICESNAAAARLTGMLVAD
jgi:FdrA protein